jgi:uridine phosphorylase
MSVPHFPGKFSSRPFFNPAEFLGYMKKLGAIADRPAPKAVILGYQKSLVDYVVKNCRTSLAEGYLGRNLRYIEESWAGNGDIAIVADFGIGAPAAAVMLEELVAWGVGKFVSMGMAGSLRRDLPPGSLVLCTSAYRDEGTSHHYAAGDGPAFPDAVLTARLEKSLQKSGLAFVSGPTWTTDAIYRETPLEIVGFRDLGALVVEMEASALFTVAAFRAVPIAACFSVSDTLAELAWRPEFHSESTIEGLARLFHSGVDALMQ